MSRPAMLLAASVALALASGSARAQDDEEAVVERGSDRFFFDPIESDDELEETSIDGSITSTSFFFRESGGLGVPVVTGGEPPESASPLDRYFTDLRLQLDAEHIKGSRWDFRGDLRGRYAPECRERVEAVRGTPLPCVSTQSGTFGGTELDAREFYLLRRGDTTSISAGRQFVLELAAVQFDGVKVERQTAGNWRYIGFAGLYPSKISRDIRDDYPTTTPADPAVAPKRILPVTFGAGAAYRFDKAYGSVGVVGILPLADDEAAARIETNRVFATAQGYYQRSVKLDVFHYLVVDGTGADGAGLTNLSLGVNFRPKTTVRTFVQVNRVDTETLNVIAQERLEEPNPTEGPVAGVLGPVDVVQNNISVTRIAHESARAGVNVDLRNNRFAVGVAGAFRRRGDVAVELQNGGTFLFPKAQAAEVTVHAVDRRSFKDFRFGLNVTRSFGVGEDNVDKSTALIVRGDARRELWDGKGELEANLSFIDSNDDNRELQCPGIPGADPLQCFGTSHSVIMGAGAVVFYRPKPKWFVLGSLNAARQSLTTVNAGAEVSQPAILMLSAMARIAYRF